MSRPPKPVTPASTSTVSLHSAVTRCATCGLSSSLPANGRLLGSFHCAQPGARHAMSMQIATRQITCRIIIIGRKSYRPWYDVCAAE